MRGLLAVTKPRGGYKQRDQGDREKQGTAMRVDLAFDHLRTYADAEQPGDQNPGGVAEDSQWNHHRHQEAPVPLGGYLGSGS